MEIENVLRWNSVVGDFIDFEIKMLNVKALNNIAVKKDIYGPNKSIICF